MSDTGFGLQFWITLIFGLIFGSFANVLIARLPHGKSIVRPASACPNCLEKIRWYDNLPVLSWLFILRGRCRSCRSPIAVRYPMVELLTAILFLACWSRYGWGWALWLRDWPLMVALVCVVFIDLDLRIIPDEISLGGLIYGLLTSFLDPRLDFVGAFLGASVGFGLFYGFAWIYWFLTKRSGLGGGDIKLLAMLGAFLGFRGVLTTILLSSVLGSLIGVLSVLLGRWLLKKNEPNRLQDGTHPSQTEPSIMKAAIPYGPFLVIGAIFYHLLGDSAWLQSMIPI